MSLLRLVFGLGILGILGLVLQELIKQRRKVKQERALEGAVLDEEVARLEAETAQRERETVKLRAKTLKPEK